MRKSMARPSFYRKNHFYPKSLELAWILAFNEFHSRGADDGIRNC